MAKFSRVWLTLIECDIWCSLVCQLTTPSPQPTRLGHEFKGTLPCFSKLICVRTARRSIRSVSASSTKDRRRQKAVERFPAAQFLFTKMDLLFYRFSFFPLFSFYGLSDQLQLSYFLPDFLPQNHNEPKWNGFRVFVSMKMNESLNMFINH